MLFLCKVNSWRERRNFSVVYIWEGFFILQLIWTKNDIGMENKLINEVIVGIIVHIKRIRVFTPV